MRQATSRNFFNYSRNGTHVGIYSTWFILIVMCLQCQTDTVDHDKAYIASDYQYYSTTLYRTVAYSVVMPSNLNEQKIKGRRYPVLYLLHCAGCDNRSFIEGYNLMDSINKFDMIIVIPYDGTGGGWWLDSPIDTLSQLSTWLKGEFKNHIDSAFPTYTNRSNTGVAGHSMGGFGALHNLALHPEIFGAAFSAKGLLDMVGNKGNYMANSVLGSFLTYPQNYHNVDILENAKRFLHINAPVKFYSGPNDWFQDENLSFDSLLTLYNVPHTYFENNEDHFSMSSGSMHNMLAWFDSLFTRSQSSTFTTGTSSEKKE